jgi:hypothetical protein
LGKERKGESQPSIFYPIGLDVRTARMRARHETKRYPGWGRQALRAPNLRWINRRLKGQQREGEGQMLTFGSELGIYVYVYTYISIYIYDSCSGIPKFKIPKAP